MPPCPAFWISRMIRDLPTSELVFLRADPCTLRHRRDRACPAGPRTPLYRQNTKTQDWRRSRLILENRGQYVSGSDGFGTGLWLGLAYSVPGAERVSVSAGPSTQYTPPLGRTRHQLLDAVCSSFRWRIEWWVIAGEGHGQALGGGRARSARSPTRHVVAPCSRDDRIGCVSCCRGLTLRTLFRSQRLLPCECRWRAG